MGTSHLGWPGQWFCAHMVQNCLLSEAAVPCESWGPAPGGNDDSGLSTHQWLSAMSPHSWGSLAVLPLSQRVLISIF